MNDEIDHIAELQKRLYARDPESVPKRKYGILRPVKQNVTSTWGQPTITTNTKNQKRIGAGYKKFFMFSLFFFLIALGAAAFSIYRGAITLSSKNVDVLILGNSFVGGGEELPLQIEVANKNSSDLINTTLVVEYPKGAIDQSGSDVVRIEVPLGTIPSGKTRSEAVSVVLYGEQGTVREITARITYALAGASSLFQKVADFDVTISSSPIALIVDAPAAIASNQEFELKLRNTFTGDATLGTTIVRVEYPNGFVFQEAIPAPTAGNNVWSLGDLEPGAEKPIIVRGKLVGEEGDQKSFRIYIGTPEADQSNRIAVVYNSALKTLSLAQPFIAGTIALGNSQGDIAAVPIGDTVEGAVSWVNNARYSIVSPTFTLSLEGPVDSATVESGDGYYDPLNRTITWSGDAIGSLASINTGASGQLPFSFKTTTGNTDDVKLALSVTGIIPEQNYAQQSVTNIDTRIIRFAARLQFSAVSLYSTGPIKNTGPFPPRADQETTYTVTWTARPSENALSNVIATAVLPEGVVWGGSIVPQSEQITYNTETRVVTWNAGVLPRATAVPQSKTVSFQIKTRPTKSQVGGGIELLGTTTATATDTVANVQIQTTRPAVSTRLDTDPLYSPGKERVLP